MVSLNPEEPFDPPCKKKKVLGSLLNESLRMDELDWIIIKGFTKLACTYGVVLVV